MTRKDYKLVATAIFKAELREADRAHITKILANAFEAEHEGFDRPRFIRACLGTNPTSEELAQ